MLTCTQCNIAPKGVAQSQMPPTIVTVFAIALSVAVCQAASGCTIIPPWLGTLNCGLDLTVMNPLPVQPSIQHGIPVFGAEVVNWTCNQRKKWNTFDVPDQIELIGSTSTNFLNTSWSATSAVNVSASFSTSVESSLLFGLFSGSSMISQSLQDLQVQSHTAQGFAIMSIQSFQVLPLGMPPLSSYVTQGLESLAGDGRGSCVTFNSSTVSQYQKFINRYGVAVASAASLGGAAYTAWMNQKSYANSLTTKNLALQGWFQLANFIQAAGGGGGQYSLDAAFTLSQEFLSDGYVGGDGNPFESFSSWSVSVFNNPALLSLETTRISSLLPDRGCSENLKLAEDNYAYRQYLQNFALPSLSSAMEFLTTNYFPICATNPSCDASTAKRGVGVLIQNITDALLEQPLNLATANELAALLPIVLSSVPPPPPSVSFLQSTATNANLLITNAAFCGYQVVQNSFSNGGNPIGNTFMNLFPNTNLVSPAGAWNSWTFQTAGRNNNAGVACIVYPLADAMLPFPNGAGFVSQQLNGGAGSLGTQALCLFQTVQEGFNSGTAMDLELYQDSTTNEWIYLADTGNSWQHWDGMSVACFTSLPRGVPSSLSQYRNLRGSGSLGFHFFCWISRFRTGGSSATGWRTLQQSPSGEWLYDSSWGPGSYQCLG